MPKTEPNGLSMVPSTVIVGGALPTNNSNTSTATSASAGPSSSSGGGGGTGISSAMITPGSSSATITSVISIHTGGAVSSAGPLTHHQLGGLPHTSSRVPVVTPTASVVMGGMGGIVAAQGIPGMPPPPPLDDNMPQKKFPCHLCKRSFMHKQSLDIHMRSHTGERPYSCTDCGQSFSQRATLNRHRRRVHLPKSQQCSECGRKFGCRDYLIKHIRTHTGELPYPCQKCGKRFRDKSALNQHSRSHK